MVVLRRGDSSFYEGDANLLTVFGPIRYRVVSGLMSMDSAVIWGVVA